jgi:predicted HicB family RNase H-like nuclease
MTATLDTTMVKARPKAEDSADTEEVHQLVARIPESLYQRLATAAARDGRSVNKEVELALRDGLDVLDRRSQAAANIAP